MNDCILRAENVAYSYDEGASYALDGLSLEIGRGQRVALMGANGSGKSTFFLCCTGICKPQRGALYLDGEPVAYDKKSLLRLRSRVGIVFQDPDNQLFSASVYQEISFGPLNLGLSEETVRQEVEAVIDRLEIAPFRHKPTHALSGGQKKRVSIADILVMHPDLILLDEPTAALDPKHTKIVNHLIDEMTAAGITVVLSTHDVDFAYGWADQVVLFHQGRVLTQGPPQQVLRSSQALALTNLEPPAVVGLFERLCRRGVLDPSLPCPRDMDQLEDYLVGRDD
ncbi:MAG: ABC transporter ATP-binding protein [Eubacteriales bacterium]|nr:ABC transporter ATP-binding protein [Eubacteriales bacterium]